MMRILSIKAFTEV